MNCDKQKIETLIDEWEAALPKDSNDRLPQRDFAPPVEDQCYVLLRELDWSDEVVEQMLTATLTRGFWLPSDLRAFYNTLRERFFLAVPATL